MADVTWTGNTAMLPEVVNEQLGVADVQKWPDNLELNEQNLAKVAETHHIFLEGFNVPIEEDADQRDWTPNDPRQIQTEAENVDNRNKAREMELTLGTMKRCLDLAEQYVPAGFQAYLVPKRPGRMKNSKKVKAVEESSLTAVNTFLQENHQWFTLKEFIRRLWRDGETFVRRAAYNTAGGATGVRFVDPEVIKDDGDENKGIKTMPDDVCVPLLYIVVDAEDESKVIAEISADRMIHAKIGSDSTEKRGRSKFTPILLQANHLRTLLKNEVNLRIAQSSIVLVRKVAGGTGAANRVVDSAQTGLSTYKGVSTSRERIGTANVLTTSKGVEIEFAQPQNNFSDAGPLFKQMILQFSAVTGWSYVQISGDPADNNLAGGIVAESPVAFMVQSEREYLTTVLTPMFKWVIENAVETSEIEGVSMETLWKKWKLAYRFADITQQDKAKVAQAANVGVMSEGLSKAEMSRRLGADPEKMRNEIEEESKLPFYTKSMMLMNPDGGDMASSSKSNGQASGKNQGSGEAPSHSDKQAT